MSESTAARLAEDSDMSRESLQGFIPSLATEDEIRRALEQAFDYRGDITFTLKSGEVFEAFVFDRRPGPTLSTSFARLKPTADNSRRQIAYSEIAALHFSGKDPAAGKSWEAWIKKQEEKKLAGESAASPHPETHE